MAEELSHVDARHIIQTDKASYQQSGGYYEYQAVDDSLDRFCDPAQYGAYVLERAGHVLKPLATYAKDFGAFIVASVRPVGEAYDAWTFAPAYLNGDQLQPVAVAKYPLLFANTRAHIVIDPGEATVPAYTNSTQLGIQDNWFGDRHVGIDVSLEDGLRWDVYSLVRNKIHAQEGGWREWNGSPITDAHNELTGSPTVEIPLA